MMNNASQRCILLWILIVTIVPSWVKAQGICNPDAVPPVLVNCPPNMTFTFGADECGAVVDWLPPSVLSDNCDSVNAISSVDWFTFHTGQGDGTNGQFAIYPGADSLLIVGTTNGTPGNGNNRFNVCFYSPCAGMLSFMWRAKMNNGDGFINDRVRFSIIKNRIPDTIAAYVNVDLTPDNDTFAEGIVDATLVLPGDRICFDVQSDNTDGVDSFFLRNLIFVPMPIEVVQTLGPAPGATVPQGTYPVEYTATDCGGNTSYCNFIVEVIPPDPVDLIIDCPDDFTINLPSASICDTLIDWAIPDFAVCGPVYGFNEEFDPFILGVQLTEEAEFGGDGIIGTDGIVWLNPARDTLVMIGINNGTPGTPTNDTSVITVCVKPRCAGTVSFDWSASVGFMRDFRRDEAGISINGVETILSVPESGDYATGQMSIYLNASDTLCFFVRSTNFLSEDTFIISNFSYVPDSVLVTEVDTFDITQPLGPGVYDFEFNARDCFGNFESCAFTVTIIGAPVGSMACKDINVSLNENCEALITPSMIVTGVCTESMIVELSAWGVPIPNPVDSHYLWQNVIASVIDTLNGNSCWATLRIEDKLAPVIVCRADTTDCYSFNFDFPLNYSGTDCSQYTVTTIDERIEVFNCDSNFLKAVYRDIEIKDANGLIDVCTDTIFVRRITAGEIVLPFDQIDFSCERPFAQDANGNPSPLITGVPYVQLQNGSILNIWPLNILLDCHLFISYEDTDLGEINCVRKIMRIWTVREWWCGTEITRNSLQLILINDISGPVITHAPYGFSATTGRRECTARVLLPSIEATDVCHNPIRIDIAYPGGILINQNGGYVDLPAGEDTIYYRLYDDCYNLTEYYIIIHVTDDTEPVAVCDRNTVVALNHSGFNWVPAEVFDDGSFDECAIHHFEVRRMDRDFCNQRGEDDWGPEVGFCCDDVGHTIMVGFKVIDFSGNEAICMVNVDVQDKIIPDIICLPDITIDCRFDIDYAHLEVFGKIVTDTADREKIIIDPRYYHVIGGHPLDGVAFDNCPPTILETVDFSNVNQCGLGYILRYFQARDQQGNLSVVCRQVIYIINHDTIDIGDINWPDDFETTDICDPNVLIPELLNPPYDRPVVSDDECSLVGMSYHDHVLSATLPGDPCFKIIRVWEVIDWCHTDVFGNFYIWRDTQIIKGTNIVDPVITRVTQDTVICTYDINCAPIPVTFSIEANDDCTDSTQMLYTYKIDFNGDGTIDVAHAAIGGNVASGTWPIGRHIVKWEVEDRCGNTDKEQFVLDIQNCKSPVAYCLNGISTNLVPMDLDGDGVADTAMDSVWASDFDAGSYHNCGYYVAISFSADTNDKVRVYNCDSIRFGTTKFIEMWVTDVNGNTSFCRTFVDVQDNLGFCPPSLTHSNVNGLVETEKSDRVQNVHVDLLNSGLTSVMTDYNGKFSFVQIPNGMNVILAPTKNDGWLNGVTTSDIVRIQRHILGIEALDSPYKLIAADVNKSRSITAKDVADLRRLILGLTKEINGNTSWRFVHQAYTFSDLSNVLNQNFPEVFEVNPLNGNLNLNFYAIKTGDINGSAATKGFNGNVSRNRNVMELQMEERNHQLDEIFESPVYVTNGEDFEGMQFTLQWDVNRLELVDMVSNASLHINEENYSMFSAGEGKMTFSWDGVLKNGDWILKPVFKVKQAGKLSDAIHVTSEITPALSVVKAANEDGRVVMSFRKDASSEFVVMPNEPNPWNDKTRISMMLPQAGEVAITIYDAAGKVFIREKLSGHKGYNEYVLSKDQLGHSGVYYYQVDYQTNTVTHKMVIAK
jgi:hypothetical protein